MALPMVHLSVAHRLVQCYGYSPVPAFYLGSLAPDAIHMRPGTTRKDKNAVHFVRDGSISLSRVQQLMDKHWRASEDAAFAEGYCVHILTDLYWRGKVVEPLRPKLNGTMPRHELRTLYYNECDKIDLELYDQQPWRDYVWDLLKSAETGDFEGLLSREEIKRWRNRVLSWYDKNRHKGDYQPRYISKELVLDFIIDASRRACERMVLWKSSRCVSPPLASSRR